MSSRWVFSLTFRVALTVKEADRSAAGGEVSLLLVYMYLSG